MKSTAVEALMRASKGLLYRSETDAPFEAFEWPGEQGKPDKARVLALAGLPPGTPVKTKSLNTGQVNRLLAFYVEERRARWRETTEGR